MIWPKYSIEFSSVCCVFSLQKLVKIVLLLYPVDFSNSWRFWYPTDNDILQNSNHPFISHLSHQSFMNFISETKCFSNHLSPTDSSLFLLDG
ncbi:hypothetical protein M0811_07814 [Anaeramoeba ignava]|uniref:Uncharacterized protein n=1 Tax=Anaeramoeba ignava TaxID=1746090 RepID=A0A9Q0LMH2_ANAIG|nr:hypothetical protein M0811_07814 [Anaeramoeba ignava]